MPYVRKSKRRPSVSRKLKIAIVVCFAAAAILALSALFVAQQERVARGAAEAASFTPAPLPSPDAAEEEPAPPVADFDATAAQLVSTTDPFTLTVVGDSTGYPEQGWLMASLTDLREITGRTISYHLWSTETNAYEPARIMGDGQPTLTVWNGSAPGKAPEYSTEHLAAMIPETPNMLIVNHGHNTDSALKIHQLAEDAATLAGESTAVGVMLQNPETGAGSTDQAFIVNHLKGRMTEFPGAVLIDAFTPLTESEGEVLMNDGIHPTEQGYRVWANVFLNSLGLQI